MSFTIIRKYSVVKNYPEMGIMNAGVGEVISSTYTAIIINSLSGGTAEVQFSVDADGVGSGLINFSFPVDGSGDLLKQAEQALESDLKERDSVSSN
ncbi:hypothetical protein B6J66_20190 [Klebsiella quasipneumoniae]|uniref:hypothetical protein n=1 Tax=Klebsiella quasipneumoniae TaxID=1463165 RepID=UPI000C7D11C3|nr:hypothetical protein [Klebsiella quasipneumoniae]PLJ49962.1 hypothetical protein B6J66_20190 [Klebsiella quasipneumoniae]